MRAIKYTKDKIKQHMMDHLLIIFMDLYFIHSGEWIIIFLNDFCEHFILNILSTI